MFNNILLCTHGSDGAQKAEQFVFNKLIKENPDINVTVLTIIDKDWAEMSTDDWLNTSGTRTTFKDYVEEQLSREINKDWDRIKDKHSSSSDAKFIRVVGGIEETIIEVADKLKTDLIIIGPYQKKKSRLFSVKMTPGLAATIDVKKLHPNLSRPLLIAPEKI